MKKIYLILTAIILLVISGCEDVLEEEPRSQMVPSYFATPEGLTAGVTAAYSGFRYFYGTEAGGTLTVSGTDEFTVGRDGNHTYNEYLTGLNPQDPFLAVPWNDGYTTINTCNGIIEIAPQVNLPEAEKAILIAEAKYLRAQYYYILTQLFGNVTLSLSFNQTPITTADRTPISEIYLAMINDLQYAVENLPSIPAQPGRAGKAAAMHLLAKVYLTRAWSSAAQPDDYKNAYTTAIELIENRGSYGLELLQDYGDINAEGNEHNSEVIWTVERNTNPQFNEQGSFASGPKANRSNWYFMSVYYTDVPGLTLDNSSGGLPWQRFKPTKWLLESAFADKINDTRYNNSFTRVWYANLASSLPEGMNLGDTALYMPGYEISDEFRASKNYTIITPDQYNYEVFPCMSKYNSINKASFIDPSTRPFIVHKLSETYFIAAEALFMDNKAEEAVEYINTVRKRAAYSPTRTPEENVAAENALTITVGELSIDFILTERSRELAGEYMRWFDLVRTNKLLERIELNEDAANANMIQSFHSLRPIPQAQIDLTTNDYPQNPGY